MHLKFTSKYCFISYRTNALFLELIDKIWTKSSKFQQEFETTTVSCFTFSYCENYLAVCTVDKRLLLFQLGNFQLLSSRNLEKNANGIQFTNDNQNIIIADKSGDVYIFNVDKFNKPGVLCMGHLSILLDVLVTPNSKYILTCDRDEKIRVSHFPNAYNIETYCLGHTAFVSSLSFLAHDNQILISTSGDGNVKFWKYLTSELLYTYDCNQFVYANYKNLITERPTNPVNENETKILPVRYCKNISLSNGESLACISLSTVKALFIYTIKTTVSNFSVNLKQVLTFEEEPYDSFLQEDKHLWVLIPSATKHAKLFIYEENQFCEKYDDQARTALEIMNEEKEMFAPFNPPVPCSHLYRQNFDNVGEYQKRKNQRITEEQIKKLRSS